MAKTAIAVEMRRRPCPRMPKLLVLHLQLDPVDLHFMCMSRSASASVRAGALSHTVV